MVTSVSMITDEDGNQLVFTTSVKESHKAETVVTKYPVEKGFEVADHSIRRNRRIIMEVVSANYVTDPQKAISPNTGYSSRVQEHFKRLNEYCLSANLLRVTTMLGDYENCILVSMQVTQDKDTSSVIKPVLEFEQINVIKKGADGQYVKSATTTLSSDETVTVESGVPSDPKVGKS